jgi:hypothetical protein
VLGRSPPRIHREMILRNNRYVIQTLLASQNARFRKDDYSRTKVRGRETAPWKKVFFKEKVSPIMWTRTSPLQRGWWYIFGAVRRAQIIKSLNENLMCLEPGRWIGVIRDD